MLSPFYLTHLLEAGTDEAGRGCLAGPVCCAAVLFPFAGEIKNVKSKKQFSELLLILNDSKKLSDKSKHFLEPLIKEFALSYSIVSIFPDQIDSINILNASILGMQKAVLQLTPKPNFLIVDGNRFNNGRHLDFEFQDVFVPYNPLDIDCELFDKKSDVFTTISYQTIIKGDEKFQTIAAASILAKTYRDNYMLHIHDEYPMYNWKQNKGYPTKEHKLAILKYGLTKYHRLTFKCSL